jgi:hypothetical protein
MRVFLALGLATAGIFAVAASLAPIAAQESAAAANPYQLPPTHFGSENPQAVPASRRDHLPTLRSKPFRHRGAELARAAGDERLAQLACSNRRATSSQSTTSHQAAR